MNVWLDNVVNCYNLHFAGTSLDPVVYDVGSRDGDDGAELARRINVQHSDNVVLIEANPLQQKVISERHGNSGFTLISCAVLDKEGEHEFVQVVSEDADEVGTSSLDKNKPDKDFKSFNLIQVETRRLDSILSSLGHNSVDIMKIDIEGFTWEALKSLGMFLGIVKVFHLETEVEGTARKQTNRDIENFMRASGFELFAKEYPWGGGIEDQIWYNKALKERV